MTAPGVDRVGQPGPTGVPWWSGVEVSTIPAFSADGAMPRPAPAPAPIRPGDAAAFDAVFRAHAPTLITAVRRYVDSRELAEEIVQDAFLGGWTARQQWASADALAGYVFTAARHRAVDLLRRRRVETRWAQRAAMQQTVDETLASRTADDEVYAAQLAVQIDRAVSALPERRRHIFLLYRDRSMSYADIAAHLGLSIKTIETQMARAYRALREALAGLRDS